VGIFHDACRIGPTTDSMFSASSWERNQDLDIQRDVSPPPMSLLSQQSSKRKRAYRKEGVSEVCLDS
jgi:hypothetical protein